MSATQRIFPLLIAATVGVVSGAYVFDPLLRQYVAERPAVASAAGREADAPPVLTPEALAKQQQAPPRTIAEEGRAELRELAEKLQRKSEGVKERAQAQAPAAAPAQAASQPQPNSAAPQKLV